MLDTDWIEDLDADTACAVVADRHAQRLRVEGELFVLAAHWADLHSGAALSEHRRRAGIRVRPGMERARQVGAHGTPTVAEFAAAELGALQGIGHVAADHLIRDALNVRHRHPRLWARLTAGRGRVWQARQVAQMCAAAGLDLDQADWVDEQTTEYLDALPWGRFESLVATKIAEADPAAADARARAAALRRFVATGQSSEHGLKTLIARATAGEVIYFVAMVDRIARILAVHGDTDPLEVRRSKAIGILATPARALQLLGSLTPLGDPTATTDCTDSTGRATTPAATTTQPAATTPEQGPDRRSGGRVPDGGPEGDPEGDPEVVTEADVHPAHNDADDPAPEPRTCPTCTGTGSGDRRPDPVPQARRPRPAPAAARRHPLHPPLRDQPDPQQPRHRAARGRRPDHHQPGRRVPRPHQRPRRPRGRPRQHRPRRRLRGPRPDGRGPAPAQPRLRLRLGHPHRPHARTTTT